MFTEGNVVELFSGDTSSDKSLGMYIEDLLESRQDLDAKAIFTVQDFMSLYQNKTETMMAPVISIKDEKLVIEKYCIVSRGADRGTLSIADSAYAQILMGKQKKLSLLLEEDQYVTLQDIRRERSIFVGTDGLPQQKLIVKGNLKLSADWIYTVAEKEQLLEEAREKIEKNLNDVLKETKEEKHTDITNSYLALSLYDRKLWKSYLDNPDAYEKQLETTVEVRLKLLNT